VLARCQLLSTAASCFLLLIVVVIKIADGEAGFGTGEQGFLFCGKEARSGFLVWLRQPG
jgi:hypothetical protein